ncbi:MAG TPA: alpha/beta hydrolase fold domain-containing protein, partial [Sedimentisphaerales bacterium]|nr:alpha/beta hydrolase fold domain-containing protein [Sedimentisphaerales bacterium]
MGSTRTILLSTIALAMSVCSLFGAAQSPDAQRERAEKSFAKQDKNGDGKLSRDEFPPRMVQIFDQIDTDKDGAVTQQEYIAFRTARSVPVRAYPARRPAASLQTSRTAQKPSPDGTKVERDIVYAQIGDRKLLLDLYVPGKGKAPMPVVVWIHGGGWRNGSKGSGGPARPLVERGYAVVDVDYRLSGEAIFPAQIQDCKAAVRWVRANAAKYGLDSDRIGAWGSSAGGHLVALLGTAGDAREFDTEANRDYSSRVQAVCDWFGPTDLLQMDAHAIEGSKLIHDAPNSPESLLVGGPIQQEPYRTLAGKVNPITYVTKDDPAFLIMHGDKDMLVSPHQSELLYDALKKAGVDATLQVVKGAGHGLRDGEESPEKLFETVAAFFDEHLKPKPQKLAPTHADEKYGEHEKQAFDLYLVDSEKPTPLFIWIHGGGFRGGDKRPVNAAMLQRFAEHGVSFASMNYRLTDVGPYPMQMLDAARGLQTIRQRAKQYNIDPSRIACGGSSAGAGISMWLLYHDDLAEPASSDPVARQSTRITCAVSVAGQTSYDPRVINKLFDTDQVHEALITLYRMKDNKDLDRPEVTRLFEDVSIINHATADDPPLYLYYPQANEPLPPNSTGQQHIHHPKFGFFLREKTDKLGLETVLKLREDYATGDRNSSEIVNDQVDWVL